MKRELLLAVGLTLASFPLLLSLFGRFLHSRYELPGAASFEACCYIGWLTLMFPVKIAWLKFQRKYFMALLYFRDKDIYYDAMARREALRKKHRCN